MKNIGLLFLLAITLFSYGQSNKKVHHIELNLNTDSISQIGISNYCGPMDSCQTITYKLSVTMNEGLIERLNKSDLAEPCEFTNLYWLKIYFNDGAIITYITNGFLLKEVTENDDYPNYTTVIKADDLCLKIKDLDYISNLWEELYEEKTK